MILKLCWFFFFSFLLLMYFIGISKWCLNPKAKGILPCSKHQCLEQLQCFSSNYFVMIFCLRNKNVLIFIGHGCYTPWILVFSRVCRCLIQFCKIRPLMYKIGLLSALKKYCKRLSFLRVFHRSVLLCPLVFVNDIHWGSECEVLYYCEPALTTNSSFCKIEMCSSF